jgi:cytochrome d ubiquinol oxidase subunit II
MGLNEVPIVLILVGLAAYTVLGGADFGAGFWQLTGGRSERGKEIREHAHHAMGPVWEANHVWLIFVLVVCWTAYPRAFGSIMSTLAVPFFVAGIGIILRGGAYALRSGTATAREQRRVETLLGISSVLTPFALGAAVGGIASGRVAVGNAEGDLVTSWLNETSIMIGVIAVAAAAYLAAVYLAADAVRLGRTELAESLRARALATGLGAGAVAIAGLFIVHEDARPIWDGLTSGAGLAAVLVSIVAGGVTLWLVWKGRFEPARATAALAVSAIIAGWGFAQSPTFLPGLTIDEAAAGHSALVSLIVSVAGGAVFLIPSLWLLFGLKLRGRFDAPMAEPEARPVLPAESASSLRRLIGISLGCFAVGTGLLVLLESTWAHVTGAFFLVAFVGSGLVAVGSSAAAPDFDDALDLRGDAGRQVGVRAGGVTDAEDRAAGHDEVGAGPVDRSDVVGRDPAVHLHRNPVRERFTKRGDPLE